MKIAFFSTQSYDRDFFNRFNTVHDIVYIEAPLNAQTVQLAQGCGGVCAFVNDKITAEVLAKLHEMSVHLIAMRCAGFNNIDLNALKKYELTAVRVPAYSPHAVAEHAVALMMTLNRKTHKAYNRIREGNFSLERLVGFDFYGKTVGVVGVGKIGEVFCRIMRGFGCRVLAFDLVVNEALRTEGVIFTDLDTVLGTSDIISLHCPLNEHTKHLINATTLQKMKRGAMLINTGRGALIDTKAVIEALKSGHLGYLALDVYEQEDKLFFHDLSESIIQDEVILRLISFPNVLITAHQAFFTEEALSEIATITLKNISDFEQNLPLSNKIS